MQTKTAQLIDNTQSTQLKVFAAGADPFITDAALDERYSHHEDREGFGYFCF